MADTIKTIEEKLTTVKTSLSNIKTSIVNKGQTPTGDITTYATAIDNISTGTPINNQDKTITSNGSYTADEGYTGLGTVNVNVDTVNNTNLTVTPKTSQQTLTPTSPYTGYDTVTVEAVTSNIDNSIKAENIKKDISVLGVTGTVVELKGQTKTITSNGTTTPDRGYNGLTSVTVNVPTGITPTGTISITKNGTHDVTNYASAEVNVASSSGVQCIFREITADGNLSYPSTNFTFSFPDNLTHNISDLNSVFCQCTSLTSVDFNNVTSIGEQGLYNAFSDCPNLTSVNFGNVQSIGKYGLNFAFSNCKNLTTVNFSNVSILYADSLSYTFSNDSGSGGIMSSVSFPALTSSSFPDGEKRAFSDMLRGIAGCTVHFPSNLESVIGKWYDVTDGFSGVNTTVLFDLPATT